MRPSIGRLVGNPRATDQEVMAWVRAHGRIVFSHDLDFSNLLAVTKAKGQECFKSGRKI